MRLMARKKEQKPRLAKYDGTGELGGHRFHLRVDSRGRGVLLVDASRLIFLNGTAVDIVEGILAGLDEHEAYRRMRRKYRKMRRARFLEDRRVVERQLTGYLANGDGYLEVVGSEDPLLGADDMPSPYRMDIALTYRCQNDCAHCYNETRDKEELDTDTWVRTLEWLWDAGIPHIVFTGGEPTLYPGLKRLFERSEELGQITGLITNGRSFARSGLAAGLVNAGMDHVQITLLSHRQGEHDAMAGSQGAWEETVAGIKNCLAEDLYVSTNTTIMRRNLASMQDTMRLLVDLGVENIAFNALIRSGKGKTAEGITFQELASILNRLGDMAEEAGVNMIWYTPTPYCEFNPVNHGLGIKQCTACSINMAIEPDGVIIPCQSYYEPLGKILGRWQDIWEHDLCRRIRERQYMPDKCKDCQLWNLCGGGCPLSVEFGDYLCGDRFSNP